MVAKVKSLQEICAKRLSKCMERFQHETFRLDSKTFAAVLRMAGSRLTEPVLTALSIANPSVRMRCGYWERDFGSLGIWDFDSEMVMERSQWWQKLCVGRMMDRRIVGYLFLCRKFCITS